MTPILTPLGNAWQVRPPCSRTAVCTWHASSPGPYRASAAARISQGDAPPRLPAGQTHLLVVEKFGNVGRRHAQYGGALPQPPDRSRIVAELLRPLLKLREVSGQEHAAKNVDAAREACVVCEQHGGQARHQQLLRSLQILAVDRVGDDLGLLPEHRNALLARRGRGARGK